LRPLYIDASRAFAVGLDGPALAVRGVARADGRFPLRRVSRVLVSGAVQWDTRALVECLRRGIPVCFAEGDGTLVGVCVGMHAEGLALHERLAEFASRPDWTRHYAVWLLAAERRAILAVNFALGLRLRDLRPTAAREAIRARLAAAGGAQAARRARGFLESAAMAFAARLLQESSVAPGLLVDGREGFNLVRDLGRLLGWDARVLAWRVLEHTGAMPDGRQLADAYQRRETRQWKLAHDYLGLLEQRVIELGYGDT